MPLRLCDQPEDYLIARNIVWMISDEGNWVSTRQELARELIATNFSQYLTNETEEILCPNCKSVNLENHTFGKISALATLFLLGIPLLFHRQGIKCRDCGKVNKI